MKMNIFKNKIRLVLFTTVLFFTAPVMVTHAVGDVDTFKLQQQADIIASEIRNLESLAKSIESTESISADAYIAVDVKSKKIISEKNTGQKYSIASVTKLMNAVIVLENVNTKTTIHLTKGMLKPEGQSPSIFPNLKISVANLLKASLIQSVNDAAEALSHAVGIGRFVKLMNKKAKALGMDHTVYYDAHGLNPKNVSTAGDLAKLMAHIYQNRPEILSITKNNDFWLPDARGRLLKFKNLNNFYTVPDFIGGKTGYLVEAKETMASLFMVNEKPVIIVVLHSDNAQADTLKLVELAKTAL